MIVRNGSSWFVMVHDVFHGGSSWFAMVSSWFMFLVVLSHGSLSWFVMVHCHGSSWFVMVHGLSWFIMVVMVHHVMVHCHGGSLSWFVMVHDVLFSKILQKRSCDPLFSQSGSQIHYQISFLMRLLIFPFPFKEHTSKELC